MRRRASASACRASKGSRRSSSSIPARPTERSRSFEDFSRRGFAIRLISQPWLGYAAQKQFALDQAREPWVLSIDADEWLDDDLRSALPTLLAADPSLAGWKLRRTLTLYGRLAPVSLWTRPEHIVRLVRRGRARFEADLLVHEGLVADGETAVAPQRSSPPRERAAAR